MNCTMTRAGRGAPVPTGRGSLHVWYAPSMREKILSVTIGDCEVQHFRAGGPGGQHQNKRTAFKRMTQTAAFRIWLSREVWLLSGMPSPEEQVRRAMEPRHLRVEGRDSRGRWVELERDHNVSD